MTRIIYASFFVAAILTISISCKKGVQQQKDELYSRHLQRNVKLEIIHTAEPDDKSEFQLLIVNDAKVANSIGLFETTDRLYKDKQIGSLLIVLVDGVNSKQEYGIGEASKKGNKGEKADHYDAFIHNELYPYAKKKAGVRKFKSVAIMGFGAGAVSAMDIAWAHPDKISKAGLFSADFANAVAKEDSIAGGAMYEKIKSSRKRPALQFWMYAGTASADTLTLFHTKAVAELLLSKSFLNAGDVVLQNGPGNDNAAWGEALPEFLKWVSTK